MTRSLNAKEINKYLQDYCVQNTKGAGLFRMRQIMEVLGSPQESIKIIHIAGTSGKTSTSYYLADMLTKSGLKVGLSVSPYVDTVTERIQINMKPIDEKIFVDEANDLLNILFTNNIKPTYFEFMTSLMYWIFSKVDLDYAVVEVGIGGALDTTNVAQSSDKVCVITDIGMDHMDMLGNTIDSITKNKAGIIHSDNHAFMYSQGDLVDSVIGKRVKEVGAKLYTIKEGLINPHYDLVGYQARNWYLAHEVYEYLLLRDKFSVIDEAGLNSNAMIQVPGRMDEVFYGDYHLIFDGAHNPQKMSALVDSLKVKFGNYPMTVLLSVKEGKDLSSILEELKEITDNLVITNFDHKDDYPTHSVNGQLIKKLAIDIGMNNVVVEPDYELAFKNALESKQKVLITGSFYLVSIIRDLIK